MHFLEAYYSGSLNSAPCPKVNLILNFPITAIDLVWESSLKKAASTARSDALAFLHLLVECSVNTDMVLWSIQQAADGDWEVP
jgi:hypothetical protein